MLKLCIATNNAHKLQEINAVAEGLFSAVTLREAGVKEELPEEAELIPLNSLSKALYVFQKTGLACLSDDSGLIVEALNGKPGVHSAHYSGSRDDKANLQKVLNELEGATNRRAYFVTVLTFINKDGIINQFEGKVYGNIAMEPSGTLGFGYDPIFVPDGYNKSFATMGAEVKNSISHRATAMALFIDYVKSTNLD